MLRIQTRTGVNRGGKRGDKAACANCACETCVQEGVCACACKCKQHTLCNDVFWVLAHSREAEACKHLPGGWLNKLEECCKVAWYSVSTCVIQATRKQQSRSSNHEAAAKTDPPSRWWSAHCNTRHAAHGTRHTAHGTPVTGHQPGNSRSFHFVSPTTTVPSSSGKLASTC